MFWQSVVSRGSGMAPVKISYVVSFSSQNPNYPTQNLLSEDGIWPWFGWPKERSRQLSVELQLERASRIGYVDVGNYGCTLLQIEVGCSSWPRDQPYLTLVPTVTLMTPADSKLDQNHYGVRFPLFKEADFLELTVGQKWDCVHLTCSQHCSPHSQFGLSFVCLHAPQEPAPPRLPLGQADASHTSMYPSPWGGSRKGQLFHGYHLCPMENTGGACWAEPGLCSEW